MKILHVTPTAFGVEGIYGGGERYVDNVIAAVKSAGGRDVFQAAVAMTTGVHPAIDKGDWMLYLLPTVSYPSNRIDYYSQKIWSFVENFDLIHVHQPFTDCGAVALIAAAQLGKRIVTTDQGGGMPSGSTRDHPISLVDRVIAISQFSADFIGPLEAPIDVIIGPVGKDFLDRPLHSGPRSGALFVGRIMPHKGIDRLISQTPAALPVTIAGSIADAEYFGFLKRLATNKQVTFRIDATDDEIFGLYSRAAIHVAPSVTVDYRGRPHPNSELMGFTTIEALASGTPVAVSATTSLPELVTDDTVGRVFNNDSELRVLLEDVLAKRWPRVYHAEAVRSYAERRFGAHAVGSLVLQSYAQALG